MTVEQQSSTLGEFLRQERERRGLTIEQVASATKISVRLLHSLEADYYADLPAKPFIRGFVTSYVRFLSLDPKEILIRFNQFIDTKAMDRPNREGGHSGYVFEKREGDQNRTVLSVVMGVFVVLGGIAIIFLKPAMRHHHQNHVDKLKAVRVTGSTPATSPSQSASLAAVAAPSPGVTTVPALAPSAAPSLAVLAAAPSPTPAPTSTSTPLVSASEAPVVAPVAVVAAAEPSPGPSPSLRPDPLNSGTDIKRDEVKHKVVFKALANVWVRYQCDDKPVMKFIFKEGKALVLRAKDKIRFQVSNPKSVTFDVAGRGAKVAAGNKNIVQRQNNATLLLPLEHAEKIEEPFPGEGILPATPDPKEHSASPSPTPAL